MPATALPFVRHFADLPDPRVDRAKKHRLDAILVIALCAVVCGADSFEDVERFGKAREDWLKRFLDLPNGIPSHDTFNRVFAALDRAEFAAGFTRWMAELWEATGLRQVAVDGKACRSAPAGTFSGCLHLVNAWAVENRLCLGQAAVAEGSHEIAALSPLLAMLDLKGALVTIDAAGCQKAVVTQVRAQGGDWLVAVKGNQPELERAVLAVCEAAAMADGAGCTTASAEEAGHGRAEERHATAVPVPQGALPDGWTDARTILVVGRERTAGDVTTSSVLYYLTSRRGPAKVLAGAVRAHWGVENGLHWGLDVAFGEDANRTRDANAGANLAAVRRAALSLLKQDLDRGGLKGKRLQAALDPAYLEKALNGFPQE